MATNVTKLPTKTRMSQEINDLERDMRQLQARLDYKIRQLDTLSDNFHQVWRDERTLRLRFNWLEECALDVVTSCSDHVHGAIGRLAEELGHEITEDQN